MSVSLAEKPVPLPDHVPPEVVVDVDFYALPGANEDPHTAWLAFCRDGKGPLVWSPYNGGHWVATVPADIAKFQRNTTIFSSAQITIPDRGGARLVPLEADAPLHSEYRRNILPLLNGETLARMEPVMRDLAIRLIEELKPRGHCEFIGDIGMKFPATVVLMILGLPIEDASRLNDLTDRISRHPDPQVKADSYQQVIAYCRDWIAKRTASPQDDGISRLIASKMKDRPYTEQEIESTVTLLTLGGVDSVAMHIGFVMNHLAQHPEKRDYVRANLDKLLPITNEFFRRYPISNMGRKLTEDYEHEGVTMRRGDMILLPPAIHNLDDHVYDAAAEIRFDRPATKGHLSFGTGAHSCPGANLARMELEIFLQEWLKRIPEFRIKPDQPVEMIAATTAGVGNLWLEWPVPAS